MYREMAHTIEVESPNVKYSQEYIESCYDYQTTRVELQGDRLKAIPETHHYTFQTERRVPKLGVMLVGWGGNNGTTVTGRYLDGSR